jgi:hypothetical protein
MDMSAMQMRFNTVCPCSSCASGHWECIVAGCLSGYYIDVNGQINSLCVRVHLPLRVLIVLVRVGFALHYKPGLPSKEGNSGL